MQAWRSTRWGLWLCAVTVGGLAILGPDTSAVASSGAGDPAPAQDAAPATTLGVVTTTLPPGCPEPPVATAVFVGTVVASDTTTVRFRVDQLRAGSLEGWQVGGLVDVDYFDDVRYLNDGDQYLVGVAPDENTRRLGSKVGEAAPLFGGNQVVGVNDSGSCPDAQDPVRTLHTDGSGVESGLLHPLVSDKSGLARALLLPAAWVFLALVILALVKNVVFGSGREMWRIARGQSRIRDEDIWRDAGYGDE